MRVLAWAAAMVVGFVVTASMLVVVTDDEDTTCASPAAPTAAAGALVGECPATGLAAEQGLRPDALRLLRCLVARFAARSVSGVRPDELADHPAGRAVDVMLDGSDGQPAWDTDAGRARGDAIVAFVQQHAAAFGVEYVIWRQRIWHPDPSGAGPGRWEAMPDRGSPTANHLDNVHVTTNGDSGPAAPTLVAATAPAAGRAPAPVSEAGTLLPAGRRSAPIAAGRFQVSDGFGTRGGAHRGVDMAAPAGTAIRAAAGGTVVQAGPASGFGNWIVIDSLDETGRAFSTVYGHMYADGVRVRTGDAVTAGQHIGDVGSAGESTGPHLHFEVWPGGRFTGGAPIDPQPWLAGAATPTDSDGGDGGVGRPGPGPGAECARGFGTAGGQLAPGSVPAELEPWYRRAGSLCPQISASLLAAQGFAEAGFTRGQTSPDNAKGLGQFIDSTATATAPDGQPYVIDADGNGRASVWDDGDAIIGQGRYMCALAAIVDRWKADGRVRGDTVALTVAAYNAGEGAVLASGGMPDQVPRHFTETQPYVAKILATEPRYRAPAASGRFVPDTTSAVGPQVLTAARQYLGTPYVYGGGGPQGPSNGGLDCSGLTSAAVFAATSGRITLPRTSEQQWRVGTEITLDAAQPGDLVFGEWGPAGPGHVGIYAGAGRMVHAPQSGEVVTEAPVHAGMKARRVA